MASAWPRSAAVLVVTTLAVASPSASALAIPSCSDPGSGWCLYRRLAGDVQNGELGFRFGEPLDMDGDGQADVAAGARFKLQQGTLQNGSASVWSGSSGALIRAWDGEFADGLFGHWVLPIADVSGDGLGDVVIVAPNAKVDGAQRGLLVARSPATGVEIWRRPGSRTENLGWDLAPATDHDGDGRTDLLVGAPSFDGGRVYLVSGRDGTTLRAFAPAKNSETFGWYVAQVDDLDGDGRADLAVGAPLEPDDTGALVGAAYAFSSETGRELVRWRGESTMGGFGEIVAGLGDLDGDGKGEIAVASPRTGDHARTLPGEVRIYSGARRDELRLWSGSQPGELYGRMVVSAGDLDGDGIDDVAVSAPWHATGAGRRVGRLELRSGRTGAVLAAFPGDGADCWFGWHIRRAPDPGGTGRPALLIGSLRHAVDGRIGVGVIDLYVLRR